MYIAFDLGGTNIKYAVFGNGANLIEEDAFPTPASNYEHLIDCIGVCVEKLKMKYPLKGIAVSCPGAITDDGMIEGSSAIPSIIGRNIRTLIHNQTQLPVSVENDANCAALAEVWKGVLQDVKDAAVVVCGTGIGGSLVKDGVIHKGAHLHGGEFGYMLLNADLRNRSVSSWSRIGSTGALVRTVANQKGLPIDHMNGQMVFEMAEDGDKICQEAADQFYQANALGIFNLQYIYDPEIIAFGGAISERHDLIPRIENKLDLITKENHDAKVFPNLVRCRFRNQANLAGALYNYFLTYGDPV